jgi:hypothetical protein
MGRKEKTMLQFLGVFGGIILTISMIALHRSNVRFARGPIATQNQEAEISTTGFVGVEGDLEPIQYKQFHFKDKYEEYLHYTGHIHPDLIVQRNARLYEQAVSEGIFGADMRAANGEPLTDEQIIYQQYLSGQTPTLPSRDLTLLNKWH